MKSTMTAGLTGELSILVTDEKTVPALYPESGIFQKMPKVFATGYMVGFMEWACMKTMAPHLDEGEQSVGTHINVSHCAATPVGMTVTVKVKCIEVDGMKTVWEIEAYDDKDLIGKGTHERFTVNSEKFNQRLEKKAGAV